jgi:hypothetical protein
MAKRYELIVYWNGVENPTHFDMTQTVNANIKYFLESNWGSQFKKESEDKQKLEYLKNMMDAFTTDMKFRYIEGVLVNTESIRMSRIKVWEKSE